MRNKWFYVVFMASTLTFGASANAAPTVSSPYVSEGATTLKLKSEYKVDDDSDDEWGLEFEAAYGVTSFWLTQVGIELEDGGHGEDAEWTGLAFENKFQLAPKGALFVDPGLKLEYKRSLNGGADEVEAQLLLAKTIGTFSNKSEFGIAHEFGDDSDDETTYNFAYGLYHNVTEGIELGGEWHSDFGDTTEKFDDQDHKAGPVAIFSLGESTKIETGALFGVSEDASDVTLKAILQHKF